MTTEKNTEKDIEIEKEASTAATSDNKAVFAPLGKYAAVAVIMVGIIVTTAIMLDRQLNTVEEQLAVLETEAAAAYAVVNEVSTDETVTAEVVTAEVEPAKVESTKADTTAETKEKVTSETVAVAAAPVATPIEAPAAEVTVAKKTITTPVATEVKHNIAQAIPAAQFELTTAKSSAQARQAQLAKEYQARIDTYKAEQKKNMSDMFARIKALEAQQLDRYKAGQDGQIARLRKQITEQQKMIETLVLRNKDMFELREANVQRVQANREQVLNRI